MKRNERRHFLATTRYSIIRQRPSHYDTFIRTYFPKGEGQHCLALLGRLLVHFVFLLNQTWGLINDSLVTFSEYPCSDSPRRNNDQSCFSILSNNYLGELFFSPLPHWLELPIISLSQSVLGQQTLLFLQNIQNRRNSSTLRKFAVCHLCCVRYSLPKLDSSDSGNLERLNLTPVDFKLYFRY